MEGEAERLEREAVGDMSTRVSLSKRSLADFRMKAWPSWLKGSTNRPTLQ